MTEEKIEIGRSTVEEGKSTANISTKNDVVMGQYTLYADYLENGSFMASQATATLEIGFPVTIFCPTVYCWSNLKEYGQLTAHGYVGDTQLSLGKIVFKKNKLNLFNDPMPITGGELVYNYNLDGTLSSDVFQASYGYGNQHNLNPAKSNTFNVVFLDWMGVDEYGNNYDQNKVYPRIKLNKTVVGAPGERVTFEARVYNPTDTDTFPNDGQIRFKISNGTPSEWFNVIDGVATLNYTIPSGADGPYEITLEYKGVSWNSTKGSGALIVSSYTPQLNMPKAVMNNTSWNYGDTATLTLNLSDESGNPLTDGKKAQLLIDDQIITCTNAITEESNNDWVAIDTVTGEATFKFLINNHDVFGIGNHSIKIIFIDVNKETWSYSGIATFTIRRKTKTIITNAEEYQDADNNIVQTIYASPGNTKVPVEVSVTNVDDTRQVDTGTVVITYEVGE